MPSCHFILTVPHAICDPVSKREHTCDYMAERMANTLHTVMADQNISHTVLVGDINRRKTDLNRVQAKDTVFHKKLNKLLLQRPNSIVLDVHSGAFNHLYPLSILNMPMTKDDGFIAYLSNYLPFAEYHGSHENYICQKAHMNTHHCFLLEFNEISPPSAHFTSLFITKIQNYFC